MFHLLLLGKEAVACPKDRLVIPLHNDVPDAVIVARYSMASILSRRTCSLVGIGDVDLAKALAAMKRQVIQRDLPAAFSTLYMAE
jgi:hypothetical protein